MDYLRDELAGVFDKESKKYFSKNPWDVRNAYIDVILKKNKKIIKKFQSEYFKEDLSSDDLVKGMELLEMQRQTQLMYTSCGWFFNELSGLETVQILKYAARAIQLCAIFSKKDFETKFLEILSDAKSNVKNYGTGKDIYINFVKPSVVTSKEVACLWAISSLYQDFEDEENVYCYSVKRNSYKKVEKGNSNLVVGNIEIYSRVTGQRSNLIFTLMQYSDGDFHCAIKEYSNAEEFNELQNILIKIFMTNSLTEIIRTIDEKFGREYFTLKDIFIEERKKILQILLKGKLKKFANRYQEMYDQGRSSIYHMQSMGLEVPDEFKISAGYTLSRRYNDLLVNSDGFVDENTIQQICDINYESKKIGVTPDKGPSNKLFSRKVITTLNRLTKSFEQRQAESVVELFEIMDKLDLQVDISEAQNIYYNKIYHRIGDIIENNVESPREKDMQFAKVLLNIGEKLNINVDFYKIKLERMECSLNKS